LILTFHKVKSAIDLEKIYLFSKIFEIIKY